MPEPCAPCAHAARHGWWGPNHRGTHCRGCHRSWTGLAEAHCVGCHEHFTTNGTADLHRQAGQCVPPGSLRRKDGSPVLVPSTKARFHSGVTWGQPDNRQPSTRAVAVSLGAPQTAEMDVDPSDPSGGTDGSDSGSVAS